MTRRDLICRGGAGPGLTLSAQLARIDARIAALRWRRDCLLATQARYEAIRKLRARGWTYAKIAARYGMTTQRAHQIATGIVGERP